VHLIRIGAETSLAFHISPTGSLQHDQNNFPWIIKDFKANNSYMYGAEGGICRVNIFFSPVACWFPYKAKDISALLVNR
jgi:hypothetical protein